MDVPVGLLGLTCLGLVLWDVFQTIVVPRPSPSRLRLARYVVPPAWLAWRALATRTRTGVARDQLLGLFAPAAAILLLVLWMAAIVIGYGLILFALRGELRPSPADLGTAIYFAGTSVLTIGYGDIVAGGGLSRLVVLTAAVAGLGVVALVITFLFSLYGSFQRREVLVVTLSARAKSPPSAITLLETQARLDLVDELPALFAEWERWTAEVLDTHVAYPLLGYFRSSHDETSWISAIGAVLDAAALVLTTIRGVPRGQAEITKRVGAHLVEDIGNNLGLTGDGSVVGRDEFGEVYHRLGEAGYDLEPEEPAWHAFEAARASFAGRLEAIAAYWATPATLWVGHTRAGASAVHEVAPVAPGQESR
ncbi:MAG: two pore domain potassium channel family protein [Chloroflexota bacterium]|nr:MAG: two pore domain potassium channel family protein [Chloroflexota bacterium]